MTRKYIASLAFVVAAFAALWFSLNPAHAAQTHIVEIEDFVFSPSELTVNHGDTVVFVNKDIVPHTATANDGSWDSGDMQPGDEWSFVASDEGVFDYFCTYHPRMVGTLIVKVN